MKDIEDELKVQNWLSIVTFDLFKYAGVGGAVTVTDTPEGLCIVLPGVATDSAGINKRFSKMVEETAVSA